MPLPSAIRRTGLVLGTAVAGAAMLLACAAGPAAAAPLTTDAVASDAGEARFETLPGQPVRTATTTPGSVRMAWSPAQPRWTPAQLTLTGLGATAGGAGLGLGLGLVLGAPLQGAAIVGGALGLGAFGTWAIAGQRPAGPAISVSAR